MAPVPRRGRRSRLSWLKQTGKRISDQRKDSEKDSGEEKRTEQASNCMDAFSDALSWRNAGLDDDCRDILPIQVESVTAARVTLKV